mgnify:CR=1 FL=1
MFLEILKAILMGIVEGITEWLPISSTGHMILVEQVVKFNASEEFMSMFRVVIQLGAILAVVVLFWNKLWPFGLRHGRVCSKTAVWQLPKELRDPDAFVSFNSVAPGGLDLLVDAVQSCFPAGTPADAGSLLTNARQESAVRRSLETVRRALSALDSGLTPDAVLTDAEEALESIGELTGRTAKEEIVGAVFSRFCVGK